MWSRTDVLQGIRRSLHVKPRHAAFVIHHCLQGDASLAQKFLLTDMPNMRGVMIVALSSIFPVTGLSAPATGT